jgi:glycerate-2-kinase
MVIPDAARGGFSAVKNELLIEMFRAALSAVDPYQSVRKALRLEGNTLSAGRWRYSLGSIDRVIVIGAGKAAAAMALAVEDSLGDAVRCQGVVIVKYGHAMKLRTIEQVEAAHPVPDNSGVYGTRRVLEMLQGAGRKTLVLCLLSGGASALLVDPLPGISLEDKQKSTDLLLRAGASVYELNTVLKHLSGVKGGRLARAAYPAPVLTLTLSDVIGDRIDVIGSGPTVPGNSTFCDAVSVIEKFGLRYKLPAEVVALLDRGTREQEPETAGSTEACFARAGNVIVGGMAQALFSAAAVARAAGYGTDLLINEMQGEAREAARALAKRALRLRDILEPGEQRCLLFGGESTTAKGNGRAGRSRELAVAFAREIAGIPGITLLSAGTKGTDGSIHAAVLVDGDTVRKSRQSGKSPHAPESDDSRACIDTFDLSRNLERRLIKCPAGTNAADIQMLLVE